MPLRLTLLERVLVRFDLLPVPLLDTLLSVGKEEVLVMACEQGLFDVLSEGPLALEALAEGAAMQSPGAVTSIAGTRLDGLSARAIGLLLQQPYGSTLAVLRLHAQVYEPYCL